jgi:transcriptional regulator with XRE-family HTH domain
MSEEKTPTTENGDAGGARRLEQYIGTEIRRHRKRHGLTVAEMAQQAGLSQGMLSKIENGQVAPSLATLSSLAGAMNVPISAFFTPFEQSRDVTYVPKGQGLEIDRRGTRAGHVYKLLGHGVRGEVGVEPYLITLTEESEAYGEFRHEGVEFIYMLSGEVVYRHGERTFHLKPGDSLFFDAIVMHGPQDLVELPAVYLSVISYPRGENA